MSKKKKYQFEESFQKLEEIVSKLESGQEPLEKNLELFEEGMSLMNICKSELDQAEQKIQSLIKKSDGTFDLKNFK